LQATTAFLDKNYQFSVLIVITSRQSSCKLEHEAQKQLGKTAYRLETERQ